MSDKWNEYMQLKEYSPITIKNYMIYEKCFLKVGDVSQESVNRFCIRYKHHVAKSFLKAYKKCFDYSFEVPLHKKIRMDVMYDLGGYLSMDKIDRVLSYSKTARDYILFLLMFRCGRRISEVLPLKAGDINFDDGIILFHILKKRREYKRYKAVDSEVLEVLKGYINALKLDGESYIFKAHNSDTPITRQMAHLIFREMCEKAGIQRVGSKKPHTHHLRHSHAINFLKNISTPYGLKILQQQLEHSDIKSTSIYLQFSQEDQKKMLEEAFVRKKPDSA